MEDRQHEDGIGDHIADKDVFVHRVKTQPGVEPLLLAKQLRMFADPVQRCVHFGQIMCGGVLAPLLDRGLLDRRDIAEGAVRQKQPSFARLREVTISTSSGET